MWYPQFIQCDSIKHVIQRIIQCCKAHHPICHPIIWSGGGDAAWGELDLHTFKTLLHAHSSRTMLPCVLLGTLCILSAMFSTFTCGLQTNDDTPCHRSASARPPSTWERQPKPSAPPARPRSTPRPWRERSLSLRVTTQTGTTGGLSPEVHGVLILTGGLLSFLHGEQELLL